jgi:hypothetical protein
MKANNKQTVKESWMAITVLAVININIWSQGASKLPLIIPELKDVTINDLFWVPLGNIR